MKKQSFIITIASIVVIITVVILVYSASNPPKFHSPEEEIDYIILSDVELYLKYPEGVRSAEEVLGTIRDYKDSSSNPNKFDELELYLKAGDLERAKEIYNELGGEPIRH